MKKLKVKEILNMKSEELEKMMTEEEFERMQKLGFEYTEQFLEALQESAKLSGQDEDEDHISISEYLDYLEDMKSYED